jgi:ubiquinone/menaquinone biosynthesis C-methylase UbiE
MNDENENTSFSGTIPFNYDSCLGPMLFEPYAIILSRRIKAFAPKSVLEVACGTGRLTKFLPKVLAESARIIATDLNADMIEYARNKHRMVREVEFLEADAQNLPFEDNFVDCIVIQFGVMFFEDKVKAFREMYRLLSPGGTLLFCAWDQLASNPASAMVQDVMEEYFPEDPPLFMRIPFSYFDQETIKKDLKAAGFKHIEIAIVPAEGFPIDASSAAKGLVYGSPLFNNLSHRAPALIPSIVKRLEIKFVEKFGERFVTSLQAIVVETVK